MDVLSLIGIIMAFVAIIGGNVWLTRSVPSGANITQANLQHDDGTQK